MEHLITKGLKKEVRGVTNIIINCRKNQIRWFKHQG
jgi:hypothetical protein